MQRQGYTFCFCPDYFLMRNYIREQLSLFPPKSSSQSALSEGTPQKEKWQEHIFWGNEPLPEIFWETLLQQGLMPQSAAIIVRHAQALPAEQWKILSQTIAKPIDFSWLFLCIEVEFEKNEPKLPAHIQKLGCLQFAQEKRWVWNNAGFDIKTKKQFIENQLHKMALEYSPAVLSAIVATSPQNASAIMAGLEQLRLMAEKEITLEMVENIKTEPEIDIFTLIRILQNSRQDSQQVVAVWRQLFKQELTGDALVFSLLALLQREARILWQLLVGDAVYLPGSVVTAKKQMAQKIGFVGLGHLWEYMFDAECSIKSGERNPDQALELLVGNLFSLFTIRV